MISNLFYFRELNKIGGTEQFLYEIAKKYNKYDILVLYDNADLEQVQRLRKLVRTKRRTPGEIIRCKKAFFNYNIEPINEIEAEQYYFVSHAIYQELQKCHNGYIPPLDNTTLTDFIGVSKYASDMLDKYAQKMGLKIKTKTCYDPLTLEPQDKVIRLVSAGRLDDIVKGGERTLRLIDALDEYCDRTGRHYIWEIFTNPTDRIENLSPNVAIMKPRIDVRPYIADADYVLQLSNDMETYCYTINEALGYGVPIVTTPLSILKELPITDNEHIVLDWDCSNIREVARQIFEKKVKPFKYKILEDTWDKILAKDKSNYNGIDKIYYEVEALPAYKEFNMEENGRVPQPGERFIIPEERLDYVLGDNPRHRKLAMIIKEIENQNSKK